MQSHSVEERCGRHCRAFLGRRRGAIRLGNDAVTDRRGGGLKMYWTKPLHDWLGYGY
jgi:hypothetical protein